ncbi:UvrD-helicase domain-containing protein [Prescottella equi]
MTFAPTDEQLHIQELFRSENPLLVRAGAGTGKTSTLLQLADILAEQDRIGLYLAFNKSIADEAGRKFSSRVRASTAHGLAHRHLRTGAYAPVLEKLRMGKVPFSTTERALGISPISVPDTDGRPRLLTAYKVTRHVLRTVERFCTTADTEIGTQHVPPMVGLDAPGQRANHDILAAYVVPLAQKAWADLTNPGGAAVKFSHGHYLKLWALSDPKFGPAGAALYLDEAQDTSPVLAAVLAKQTHLQKVLVGDSSQSIYRFTGATNAMNKFGDLPEGRLTRSWRFGQEIADAANHLLAELGDDLRLSGNPAITSQVTTGVPDVDAILTRTNGVALERVMEAQRSGKRVHLMGDQHYALRFCEGAEKLMACEPAGHEDLAAFTTWAQVQDHAEDSPDSSDWKTLVDLIDNHGVPAVKNALARSVPESSAQLIVATAHKSKGREWNRVQLADDLAEQLDSAREAVEERGTAADRAALADELMLNYVAVTRARVTLGAGAVIPPELHTRTVAPAALPDTSTAPAAESPPTLPFSTAVDDEPVTVTIEFTSAEAARIRAAAGERIADWLHELATTATAEGEAA